MCSEIGNKRFLHFGLNLSPYRIQFFAGLILVGLLTGIAYFSGFFPDFLYGEEYLLYTQASLFPLSQAVKNYYEITGRLFEGLYWNWTYTVFGFEPVQLRIASVLLLASASMLASACFRRIWPTSQGTSTSFFVMMALLTINPVSLSLLLKLSTDNGRLSLVLFFASCLLLQNWASSGGRIFLVASVFTYFLGLATYENIALLYPAACLLSYPLLRPSKKGNLRTGLVFFAVSSPFYILVLLKLVEITASLSVDPISHPAVSLSFQAGTLLRAFISVIEAVESFGVVDIYTWFMPLVLLAGVIGAVLLLKESHFLNADEKIRQRSLVLGLIWIIFVSLFPYSLLGYGSAVRVYSAAIFGLVPLVVFFFYAARHVFLRFTLGVLLFAVFIFGLIGFASKAKQITSTELSETSFYLSLKRAVPDVRSETIFVFLDRKLSNSGCGPSLEMLYSQSKLRCVYLSSADPAFLAVRYRDFVEAGQGGWLRTEYRVIVGFDQDGNAYVVSELTPESDFGMLIDWRFDTPISTDFETFDTGRVVPQSQFYLHLVERATLIYSDH